MQFELSQGVQDLAGAPVDLFDDISIQPARALAGEPLRSEQRHMRHGVRQVEEERASLVRLDESKGLLSVAFGEGGLISWPLDDLFATHQGHVPVLRFRIPKDRPA